MATRPYYELEILLRRILKRVTDAERRSAVSDTKGKVKEVDAKRRMARIEIGKDEDGNSVLSAWTPYAQIAGALKVQWTPSVGQVMSFRSENGDPQQGVLEPYHWSDDNKGLSEDEGDLILNFGPLTLKSNGQGMIVSFGGSSIAFSDSEIKVLSGRLSHNDRDIGSTHTHPGIERGGESTFPPNP